MVDPQPADPEDEESSTAAADAWSSETGSPEPPEDARERVERLRQYATLLDDAFRIPGTGYRIGIDPIIGVLPFGGDLTTAALSMVVVLEAWRMNAPDPILARMLANVGIDTLAGSVPFLGDAFDAAWKANVRNVDLLEDWVEGRATASAETL